MSMDKDYIKAKDNYEKYQNKADDFERRMEGAKGLKLKQLERRRKAEQKMADIYKERMEMIESPEYQETIANSKWTKAAEKMDSIGNKMQSTGKGMVKAGMHTTAAVWTPAIYLGYRGVKHVRNKPKNESVEQDLIELINEVEKAHKDGKITEAQKKEYVLDFVDNYYR